MLGILCVALSVLTMGGACWRIGYAVGQGDRECGVSAPWPWSTPRYHAD